jgi:putative flippase GtrA
MSLTFLHDPRFLRFVLVGGLCFLTNLTVLYLATERLGLHYLVAMGISIVIANTLGWALNRRWTFASRSRDAWAEFGRYVTVNLSGFALSLGLMALLVSGLGLHYLIASALIAAALMLVNFVVHRSWSFADRDG